MLGGQKGGSLMGLLYLNALKKGTRRVRERVDERGRGREEVVEGMRWACSTKMK
jgi:hypothetical protein